MSRVRWVRLEFQHEESLRLPCWTKILWRNVLTDEEIDREVAILKQKGKRANEDEEVTR
jgi:hypothetical protein